MGDYWFSGEKQRIERWHQVGERYRKLTIVFSALLVLAAIHSQDKLHFSTLLKFKAFVLWYFQLHNSLIDNPAHEKSQFSKKVRTGSSTIQSDCLSSKSDFLACRDYQWIRNEERKNAECTYSLVRHSKIFREKKSCETTKENIIYHSWSNKNGFSASLSLFPPFVIVVILSLDGLSIHYCLLQSRKPRRRQNARTNARSDFSTLFFSFPSLHTIDDDDDDSTNELTRNFRPDL